MLTNDQLVFRFPPLIILTSLHIRFTEKNLTDLPKHRSLVDDISGDSLSDLDPIRLPDEVAIHRPAALLTLHGLQTAHAAIFLETEKQKQIWIISNL